MANEEKKCSRLTQAMLETVKDMRNAGVLDEADYTKITLRHLGVRDREGQVLTGKDMRVMEHFGAALEGNRSSHPKKGQG